MPLVEVTVNSKNENSLDFCPICVQEYGLSALFSYFLNRTKRSFVLSACVVHLLPHHRNLLEL
jgi:hypothetical protein